MGEARRRKLAAASLVAIHPSSRLPEECDGSGQYWLPPVWLWPESPWPGSWEWQHEPEYLVRTGRAAGSGEAQLLLVDAQMLAHWLVRKGDEEVTPELIAGISAMKWKIIDDPRLSELARNFMHQVPARV